MRREVVEVARGIHVATSRRYATTTTLVTGGAEALLVDPAWDADELEGLAGTLAALDVTCSAGLSTHVHYDHVLWHPRLPSVPRWATGWSVEAWLSRRDELLAPLVGDLPPEILEVAGRLSPLAHEGALPWTARELVLHEHDAHAPHHLAVEVADAGVLIAGDMLSDVELPMPDDADPDLTTYREGLDRLAPVVARMSVIVPGHGSPSTEPMKRLDADRRYLDDLVAGRPVDDPRIGLPGMAELHAANLARATRLAPGPGDGV